MSFIIYTRSDNVYFWPSLFLLILGKYSTMYNAVNTEEEEAGITFKKETEEVIPGPTAVWHKLRELQGS